MCTVNLNIYYPLQYKCGTAGDCPGEEEIGCNECLYPPDCSVVFHLNCFVAIKKTIVNDFHSSQNLGLKKEKK